MEKDELKEKCEEIFSSLNVTHEQCQNVERVTKEQSKSKEWHTLRIGRITASQMKSACTSSTETPAISTLNAICGNTSFSNKATQWGCDHEAEALSTYKQKVTEIHENVSVKKCGLYLTPKHPHIGASPDAIVTCDCCGNGVVEIKCPYCVKDKDLKDAGTQLNFLRDGKLKSNHKYFYQVQTQMLVTEMDYCDFVVWTERGCSMERIEPNEAIQMEIIDKSQKYFVSVVLP
ncbi:uncharacterized protein [Argopecten irradians]|uniref:uncharacterized protein n=1 Tax=Argopecten irradians TaxID=31199 RepID=UPI0037102155